VTPDDYPAFAALWPPVSALYQQRLTASVLELYWQVLKPYSLGSVREALLRHIQSPAHGTFYPKPADLLRYLLETDTAKAEAAWDCVLQGLGEVGMYRSIEFEDPNIAPIIHDLGGWTYLNSLTYAQLVTVAQAFLQRYRTYALETETVTPKTSMVLGLQGSTPA